MSPAGSTRFRASRTSAARSIKWSAVENVGLALISLGSLVVYARFLSVGDFGLFSIVLALIELMTAFVSSLFHDALVQRRNVRQLHYDTALTVALALSVVLVALCWLIGPMLSRQIGAPDAAALLGWMSPCIPFAALGATLAARLRRELDFKLLALRNLIARTAAAVAGFGLILLGHGLWGLVAQQITLVGLGALVLWVRCKERPRLRFGVGELRELMGFGVASVSALLLSHGTRRAFTFAAGVTLGTHAAGLLNLTLRTVDGLWSLAWNAVSQVALPVLASVTDVEGRFRRVFANASSFSCLTLYFPFVLLAATSEDVVHLLYGGRWNAIAPYVSVLALQVLVQAHAMLSAPALTALGHVRSRVVIQIVELAFLAAAIAWSGIPTVGWAIGVWLATGAIGAGLQAWMVGRAIGSSIRELSSAAAVPLLAALAMFAAVSFSRAVLGDSLGSIAKLALLGLVGALVYFGCVALLKRPLLLELAKFVRAAFRHAPPGVQTS